MPVKIVQIDFWEQDAFLEIDEQKFFFGFAYSPGCPTLEDAIKYFEGDREYYKSERALALLEEKGLYKFSP